METIKITKKHHKHLNNPFPSSTPRSLPFVQGNLSFNPQKLPSHQTFCIGKEFQLTWESNNGGSVSISHHSQPSRPIWSSIPGQAFVSAAIAETEVQESRGSFVIKDRNVHFVCNHQIIEDIRVIDQSEYGFDPQGHEFSYQKTELKYTQFPLVLITGEIFSSKKRKKEIQDLVIHEKSSFLKKEPLVSARYWVLLDQKNSNQIGFQVQIGKPNSDLTYSRFFSKTPGIYRGFSRRLGRLRRRRIGWCGYFSKRRTNGTFESTSEENVRNNGEEYMGFNRVCMSYSSEKNERFYGFGEQFSHMDLKGKRVPIFVQEQGIGRGDQPITFAANLVSYRAGGDWSTTYAPSPFYITSKMTSLYLEGYNYSVFDLTRHDKVQIEECLGGDDKYNQKQSNTRFKNYALFEMHRSRFFIFSVLVRLQMHGDSIQGSILYGNSPLELIEHFAEAIGRPPMLPEWIISGAVVGMQGGTDIVRDVWDKLGAYNVPISAFWLQDWVGQRKTVIGSQLWWNWEVDTKRYSSWQQLIRDLRAQKIKVMTYCNPCLAPVLISNPKNDPL
ncbi:hypothetical protein U1Q18_013771 [Sarracenia purpurea var. burkii]